MKQSTITTLLVTSAILLGIGVILPIKKITYKDFLWYSYDRPDTLYADLVVDQARIWTGNSHQLWAEAIAIIGDTVAAIGTSQEIQDWISDDTQLISAQGGMIVPGFIDSHVHFLELGITLQSVQLRDAKTKEEFVERIANYASTKNPGEWILGGTWDHENWGGELPHKDWIDAVTPDNPVWIGRLDGHMSLANSRALVHAELVDNIEDVAGGSIVRDSNGRLTGIFKDNAQDLVLTTIPELSIYDKVDLLKAAMDHLASNGVTSVTDMDGNIALFEAARNRHLLKTRIYAAAPLHQWESVKSRIDAVGYGDDWIKTGALKAFVDGSLGSHTALFLEPFTDQPDDYGLLLTPLDSLYSMISEADAAGLHLMVHAIGDSAIHSLLDIYERVTKENGPRDRRFKIEHAQHIRSYDMPRFYDLKVIASMQPYHAIDDGRWAEKLIGPMRIKTTHAFNSLLDAGAIVAFGSDTPVAPPSPLEGIYAAVTRQTLDGANPNGWVPKQKITVEEALYAYTRAGAYASYDLDKKGTLEVGKLADFVVIDRDITGIPVEEIREAQVKRTFVGGNMVYHQLSH